MGRRSTLATALVLSALGGSMVGVAAQDGASDAISAAVFDIAIDASDQGAPRIEADDARASGAITIGPGEAVVIDELVLVPFAVRVENDGGAWTGTGRGFGGGAGRDVNIWELQGEGGYQGLSLFVLTSDAEDVTNWGMIIPTEAIPPFPDLPEE